MAALPSLHPTDQTLQAYGLGTLDEDTSASVDSHLADCSECRRRASEMSGDSFLSRLREAHEATGPTGGPSSAGARGRGSSSIPDDGPPRELVDHPDYEVVRELGRGGMGVVYLAQNTLMGRMEVLKVVGSHLVKRQGVLDRFLREIRSAAKLQHPNIVGAYAAMRLGEGVVLAMEYVEGEDLAQLVKARGRLPVTNACYFTYQAALGLQHAHERGMVHRDIKPANLILAREGKKAIVKVLDFGLAKATSEGQFDAGLTHEGQMLGTPDFIAPEQILDAQKADIRADIYGLGCTLYYLLSGAPPFRGRSLYDLLQAHHSMDAPALNLTRPEVPTGLAALVAKMMAKDPAQRFQTPGEVALALAKFFKPGAQPSSGSNAELPRAVPPVETPPAPAATATTQAATDPGAPAPAPAPAPAKRSKASPEGVAWGSLIEFKETEPSLLPTRPKPPEPMPEPAEAEGKPPRSWWPVIAGASAFGSIALGIIITIKTNNGTTKVSLPEDKPARVETSEGIVVEHKPSTGATSRGLDPSRFTTTGGGRWEVQGDTLVQSDAQSMFAMLLFGDDRWTDYDFSADLQGTEGASDAGLIVRSTGEDRNLRFAISGKGDSKYCFLEASEGGQKRILKSVPYSILSGAWCTARVRVRGGRVTCSLHNGDRYVVWFDFDDDLHPKGRVGLATWHAACRFKNIRVTTLDGKDMWEGLPAVTGPAATPPTRTAETTPVVAGPAPEVRGGAWKVEGDELVQSSLARGATLLFGEPWWSSYDFKFRAMSTGGTHGFKAKFHAMSRGNACEFALGNYFNKYHDLSFESIGRWGRADQMLRPGHIEPLRWYAVRLEVRGAEYRCFLDDALLFQGRFDPFTAGRVGFATWDNTAKFRDIEVTAPDGRVLWRGPPVPPAGRPSAATGPRGPTDYVRAGSVWVGSRSYRKGTFAGGTVTYELYITKRDGNKFLGHVFDNGHGRNRAEVEGEVSGPAISWRERPGHIKDGLMKMDGILSGNTIQVKFEGHYGVGQSNQGDGELTWVGGGTGADAAESSGGPGGYVPLFDGKGVAGWGAWGKQGSLSLAEMRAIWSVRDGDLIGSKAQSHLFSPRGDYKNFRVRARVKVSEGGNSGLYFRAAKGAGFPEGYEAQINSTHRDLNRTGSLYKSGEGAVRAVTATPVPSNTWFTLEVEAVGNHIRVWVEGRLTADWTDPRRSYSVGHFAIQVHDPQTVVQVRELEVMELDASGRPIGGPEAGISGAIVGKLGGAGAAREGPKAEAIAGPADVVAGRPAGIRAVPTRPGVLKIAAAMPGESWPALLPDDSRGWRAGDPSLVAADEKGVVLKAGDGGNFLITRDADYKKCSLKVELSAAPGTEAFLVLRASEVPGGWRGVTSRIVDEGGKIRAGLQSTDFALPERGEGRLEFAPGQNFRIQFSPPPPPPPSTRRTGRRS